MCFSATSSFVVASALTLTSVISLKNVTRSTLIPLTLVPLGFALQQAAEGVVWLTLDQPTSTLHKLAMYIYLSFVFIVWPLWLPWAVKLYERNTCKKMLLTLCQLLGLLFAVTAAFLLWASPVSVSSDIGNLGYYFKHSFFGEHSGLAWYLIPTVLPFLLVTNRILGTVIGSFAVISLSATYLVLPAGLISVWCFFAALISGCVLGLVWSEKGNATNIR
jgi:hypothetical protein